MRCAYPRLITNGDRSMYVPCGMCLACRSNKTTEWTVRLMFELQDWKCASFVTLTYDDEHLPEDFGLHRKDLQKFFKRLRRDLPNYHLGGIKYFACGEYGENPNKQLPTGFGRPHYHAIIFGLDPTKEQTRELITENWPFCSSFFFDKEHKGIGSCNEQSIKYVAGYIRKKLLGFDKEKYDEAGIAPPFQLCSQGLGLSGFERYVKEQGSNFDCFIRFNGYKCPVPRYFVEKTNLVDKSNLRGALRLDMEEYLLTQGFTQETIDANRCKFISTGKGGFINWLDYTYTETIRESLVEAHKNKIALYSIKKKGEL